MPSTPTSGTGLVAPGEVAHLLTQLQDTRQALHESEAARWRHAGARMKQMLVALPPLKVPQVGRLSKQLSILFV